MADGNLQFHTSFAQAGGLDLYLYTPPKTGKVGLLRQPKPAAPRVTAPHRHVPWACDCTHLANGPAAVASIHPSLKAAQCHNAAWGVSPQACPR